MPIFFIEAVKLLVEYIEHLPRRLVYENFLEFIGKSCGNFREIIRAFSTLKQKTEVPIITTPLDGSGVVAGEQVDREPRTLVGRPIGNELDIRYEILKLCFADNAEQSIRHDILSPAD